MKCCAEWLSAADPDVVCPRPKPPEEQVKTDLFEQMAINTSGTCPKG